METQPRWLNALLGTPGDILAFVWGFAEGTLFFVVPDVCFTFTTGLRPRRGLLQVALAVAGGVLAGNVMYSWAAASPRQAQSAVAAVPFVGQKMLEDTYGRLDARGGWAMLEGPLRGVPYKVYAVLAPPRMSFAAFFLWSIPARAERMLISWLAVALIALGLKRIEESRRWRIAVAAHATCWIAVYAYYWGR